MIVEYDFTAMTEKDVFEMKLKGIVPDFGYISNSKRVPFLKFLVDFGFAERTTRLEHNSIYYGRYMPLIDFRFSRLFGYSAKPVIALKGCMIYTDSALQLSNWKDA